MDAIQFGRWIGEQRHRCGWSSQRRLVEEIRQNPFFSESGISEDFLARLEAGRLAHPFRNTARQRVLSLAWFLCKSQADLRAYLRAAEISKLSANEQKQLRLLNEHLEQAASPASPLPPRPRYVLGRDDLLKDISEQLACMESGICAITGMVGIGKTTLAYEILHRLSDNNRLRQLFVHGCATFSCAGRHGTSGLLSLLVEINSVFDQSPYEPEGAWRASGSEDRYTLDANQEEVELARAIQHTRQHLAQKSLLLLLDHIEADFPLREAMEALLSLGHPADVPRRTPAPRHVLLITSRYIPAPAYINNHFHIQPLEHEAALELFSAILGRTLSTNERHYSGQVCASVGYLPLAIEIAATAVAAKGISLPLLASQVEKHPLATILDSEHELRGKLAQSLYALEPEKQQQFIALSRLGQSFDLESAARIYSYSERESEKQATSVQDLPSNSLTPDAQQLALAAADLGTFVRHSLVELTQSTCNEQQQRARTTYRLPPLFYAYAREHRAAPALQTQPYFIHRLPGELKQRQQQEHKPPLYNSI